jgi:predicted DNA binding CopG/RHH family protein
MLKSLKLETKKKVTMRIEPSLVDAVKTEAAKLGIPYQSLIRAWVIEQVLVK